MTQDISVLALVTGKERYIILYGHEQRSDALRLLGRWASNPELSFSWYDAAVLSQRIRATADAQPASPTPLGGGSRFQLPIVNE